MGEGGGHVMCSVVVEMSLVSDELLFFVPLYKTMYIHVTINMSSRFNDAIL